MNYRSHADYMIMSHFYLYNLQVKNNRSLSSNNLFIELNELSLSALFDYCRGLCCECAKFKTISVLIHLIRGSKVEVIFLHFKYKSFQKYYDVFLEISIIFVCFCFTIRQISKLICVIV